MLSSLTVVDIEMSAMVVVKDIWLHRSLWIGSGALEHVISSKLCGIKQNGCNRVFD